MIKCQEHFSTCMNDIRTLHEEESFANLIFICENNTRVRTHTVVLSKSVCKFIYTLYRSNPDDVVYFSIPDVSGNVLKSLLKLLLHGTLVFETFDQVEKVNDLALLLGINLCELKIDLYHCGDNINQHLKDSKGKQFCRRGSLSHLNDGGAGTSGLTPRVKTRRKFHYENDSDDAACGSTHSSCTSSDDEDTHTRREYVSPVARSKISSRPNFLRPDIVNGESRDVGDKQVPVAGHDKKKRFPSRLCFNRQKRNTNSGYNSDSDCSQCDSSMTPALAHLLPVHAQEKELLNSDPDDTHGSEVIFNGINDLPGPSGLYSTVQGANTINDYNASDDVHGSEVIFNGINDLPGPSGLYSIVQRANTINNYIASDSDTEDEFPQSPTIPSIMHLAKKVSSTLDHRDVQGGNELANAKSDEDEDEDDDDDDIVYLGSIPGNNPAHSENGNKHVSLLEQHEERPCITPAEVQIIESSNVSDQDSEDEILCMEPLAQFNLSPTFVAYNNCAESRNAQVNLAQERAQNGTIMAEGPSIVTESPTIDVTTATEGSAIVAEDMTTALAGRSTEVEGPTTVANGPTTTVERLTKVAEGPSTAAEGRTTLPEYPTAAGLIAVADGPTIEEESSTAVAGESDISDVEDQGDDDDDDVTCILPLINIVDLGENSEDEFQQEERMPEPSNTVQHRQDPLHVREQNAAPVTCNGFIPYMENHNGYVERQTGSGENHNTVQHRGENHNMEQPRGGNHNTVQQRGENHNMGQPRGGNHNTVQQRGENHNMGQPREGNYNMEQQRENHNMGQPRGGNRNTVQQRGENHNMEQPREGNHNMGQPREGNHNTARQRRENRNMVRELPRPSSAIDIQVESSSNHGVTHFNIRFDIPANLIAEIPNNHLNLNSERTSRHRRHRTRKNADRKKTSRVFPTMTPTTCEAMPTISSVFSTAHKNVNSQDNRVLPATVPSTSTGINKGGASRLSVPSSGTSVIIQDVCPQTSRPSRIHHDNTPEQVTTSDTRNDTNIGVQDLVVLSDDENEVEVIEECSPSSGIQTAVTVESHDDGHTGKQEERETSPNVNCTQSENSDEDSDKDLPSVSAASSKKVFSRSRRAKKSNTDNEQNIPYTRTTRRSSRIFPTTSKPPDDQDDSSSSRLQASSSKEVLSETQSAIMPSDDFNRTPHCVRSSLPFPTTSHHHESLASGSKAKKPLKVRRKTLTDNNNGTPRATRSQSAALSTPASSHEDENSPGLSQLPLSKKALKLMERIKIFTDDSSDNDTTATESREPFCSSVKKDKATKNKSGKDKRRRHSRKRYSDDTCSGSSVPQKRNK